MSAEPADTAASVEAERERHASWLELFFDLLFVAIVAQLAHGLVGHATLPRVLEVGGLFLTSWWVWVSFTYFSDIREEEGPAHRVWVLATMACLVVMGGGVGGALHGHPALFALGSGLSRALRPIQWYAAMRGAVRWWQLAPYLMSAALFLGSAAVPPWWAYGMWAVAIVLEVAPIFGPAVSEPSRQARIAVDADHMIERFGLFVIIVLGEGIAQVVAALGAVSQPRAAAVLTGLAAFALLAVVWWLYFDFGAAAALAVLRARPDEVYRLARDGLAVGHILVVGGILAASAGIGEAVSAAIGGKAADPGAVGLVCGGLLVYLVNNAAIGVFLLRQPAKAVLGWLIPDTAGVAVVWTLMRHVPPGWAFLSVAVVLAAVAGRSALARRP